MDLGGFWWWGIVLKKAWDFHDQNGFVPQSWSTSKIQRPAAKFQQQKTSSLIMCVYIYVCIPHLLLCLSCIRCNRYTVTRQCARGAVIISCLVSLWRCSLLLSSPFGSETPDIIGRRHPMSKSVPAADWPAALWMLFMRLQMECVWVRVVMWCEDFVKIRLSYSGEKLELCESNAQKQP